MYPTFPHREDDVARWLKMRRDDLPGESPEWYAVDNLLDEWRELADVGRSLMEARPEDF